MAPAPRCRRCSGARALGSPSRAAAAPSRPRRHEVWNHHLRLLAPRPLRVRGRPNPVKHTMHRLVAIDYSPWSEKARWALDARRVPYREEAYLPMIGEPRLRLRLRLLPPARSPRRCSSRPTAAPSPTPSSSRASPRRQGAVRRCSPKGATTRSRAGTSGARPSSRRAGPSRCGRRWTTPEARDEGVPGFLPSPLRPPRAARRALPARQVPARLRLREASTEGRLRGPVGAARGARRGRRHLFGEQLSYADIVMAVSPPSLLAPVAGQLHSPRARHPPGVHPPAHRGGLRRSGGLARRDLRRAPALIAPRMALAPAAPRRSHARRRTRHGARHALPQLRGRAQPGARLDGEPGWLARPLLSGGDLAGSASPPGSRWASARPPIPTGASGSTSIRSRARTSTPRSARAPAG